MWNGFAPLLRESAAWRFVTSLPAKKDAPRMPRIAVG